MWGAGFLVAVLCLLAAAPVKSETAQGLSLVYKGRGAFNSRDFARTGHCGLGLSKSLDLPWRSGVRSVAINSIQYGSSSICGLCIAYRGLTPGGPFKRNWQYGIVVDDCTKCKFGDIVVYNKGSGYHNIEWVAVQCRTGNTPFQYTFQGGNDYYFKIAISNTRVPVKAVQLKLGPKKYAKLNRMKDNFWEYNPFGRKIKFPVTLKITSYIGDSVEETIRSSKPVGTVRGTKQFPLKRKFSAVP